MIERLDNPPRDKWRMDVPLWDLFPRDLFIQRRKEGYVRVQALDNSVLAIANYTEKAQYEQVWDEVTLQCRGLIFDPFSENVVARPFPKFFNWDDSTQPYPPRGECMIMPKMDGSLGILYFHDDGYKIATRGSFTSDQAIHATAKLREEIANYAPIFHLNMTYLFEIIYPDNRIVVDYGAEDKLVLLDVIDNFTGQSRFDMFERLDWPDKVDRKMAVFDDSLVHKIPQGEEGFVLYWPHQNFRVKIKSAEYLALHKMIFGLNARAVWERMGEGETWQDICNNLPDEFHPWVKDVANQLHHKREKIVREATREYNNVMAALEDSGRMGSRKEFARMVQGAPLKSYLFMMLDGKDISEAIWNNLKPSGIDKIKVISEDVA